MQDNFLRQSNEDNENNRSEIVYNYSYLHNNVIPTDNFNPQGNLFMNSDEKTLIDIEPIGITMIMNQNTSGLNCKDKSQELNAP